MAVLEKIRVTFGVGASIIIALGLLSFIIDPSSIMSAYDSMSSKNDVGVINGKSISYADFTDENAKMTTINEIISGSSAQSAEQQAQIRNSTWQDMILRYLFVRNAHAAGINVSDAELVSLSTGATPSQLITQNPAFFDETGKFSKDMVVRFVQNMDSDQTGRLRMYWDHLQSSIVNQQYFEKYASLFNQRSFMNPLMLKRAMADNNNTANVDFVMVPYSYQKDSTIVVSESEIKKFYDAHKKLFKQNASRDIEYVVFEVQPSASDIQKTKDMVASHFEEFTTTSNMKNFLMKYSDRPYTERWFKSGELNTVDPAVNDFVWSGTASNSDIITSGNKFYVVKVLDSKMIPDSAYVKHILLQGDNAAHVADSLVGVLNKGGNFAELATIYSMDKNSAFDGVRGNLGWMTQNYIFPGFESVFTAENGKPMVVKTQYGTHVIVVDKKSAPVAKKQVAIYEKEAVASKETFNQIYGKANKFATLASGKYSKYVAAVDTMAVYSHPLNGLVEGADRLGSIDNAKEVSRWAFENKPGAVSDIKTIDNKYFVIATLKAVHKEGYAKVDEVSEQIRQQLYQEKYAEKKREEVAEKIKGLTDLQAIAEKLGVTVSTQTGLAFASMNAYGLDPKFIGAVASAKENVVSAPIAGNIGTYVFKVTSKDAGSFFTEEDAKNRQAQMSQYASQMLIPVMMQDADVKDNRGRFF